jgi:hypothetical protein
VCGGGENEVGYPGKGAEPRKNFLRRIVSQGSHNQGHSENLDTLSVPKASLLLQVCWGSCEGVSPLALWDWLSLSLGRWTMAICKWPLGQAGVASLLPTAAENLEGRGCGWFVCSWSPLEAEEGLAQSFEKSKKRRAGQTRQQIQHKLTKEGMLWPSWGLRGNHPSQGTSPWESHNNPNRQITFFFFSSAN